jgi:putative membrane protein
MTKPPQIPRKPAVFTVEEPADPAPRLKPSEARKPGHFDHDFMILPETVDPFSESAPVLLPETEATEKSGFSFGKLALGAIGLIASMAIGLWTDQLIRDLFTRADWLGYTALGAVGVALLSALILIAKEFRGMMRLSEAHILRLALASAQADTRPATARSAVAKLVAHIGARPETAKGRAVLSSTSTDIIDNQQLIALAEQQLMSPLDMRARALILNAAKRVSVVTAVSPRAVVDIGYVIYEALRLVRAMADLYGSRPGVIGLVLLMRDVIAHLAVTGSIAVGDSLIQQLLGHGVASKISARLGEGVINGLMTARIGISAMDLCRPMAFSALKRPGISDFISDLTPSMTGKKPDETSR